MFQEGVAGRLQGHTCRLWLLETVFGALFAPPEGPHLPPTHPSSQKKLVSFFSYPSTQVISRKEATLVHTLMGSPWRTACATVQIVHRADSEYHLQAVNPLVFCSPSLATSPRDVPSLLSPLLGHCPHLPCPPAPKIPWSCWSSEMQAVLLAPEALSLPWNSHVHFSLLAVY